jgi:hypothetical protein
VLQFQRRERSMSIKQHRQQPTTAAKKSTRKKPEISPLARKATRLYQTKLKALLEPTYVGKFAAIEPDSGDYFVADRMAEAMHQARVKHPDKRFFLVRIGFEAAVSFRSPGFRVA